jgi:pyridoxal phosphate enzyme (YggS family)
MSAPGVELVAPALERVREHIRRAAEQSGRDPREIRLVAVSKRQPADKIRAAYAAGQRDFGENYAQELLAKRDQLGDLRDLRFHMIGALQRNKVAGLCGVISAVHSVDSVRLIEELGRRSSARSVPPERALLASGQLAVFLEVNLGEAQKAGCAPAELGQLIDAVLAQPSLSLRGLMAIPAGSDDPESARAQFERVLELREQQGGVARLPELSLGMSRDLEVAIACGSTWVRVGTDIFGERG